eukprot:UN4657
MPASWWQLSPARRQRQADGLSAILQVADNEQPPHPQKSGTADTQWSSDRSHMRSKCKSASHLRCGSDTQHPLRGQPLRQTAHSSRSRSRHTRNRHQSCSPLWLECQTAGTQ